MVFVLLRFLIIIALILGAVLLVYNKSKKVKLTEIRREKLEEALLNIDETLSEAKQLPEVSISKLKKAREEINKILKEGGRNATNRD